MNKPSDIIRSFHLDDASAYGFHVYRNLLVTVDAGDQLQLKEEDTIFVRSFKSVEDARRIYEFVQSYIQQVIREGETEEDFNILPPLFLRACSNEIVQLSPQVYVVFCQEGPVVPIVFIKNKATLHGDEKLPNILLRLYEVHSSSYVNSSNFESVLQKK